MSHEIRTRYPLLTDNRSEHLDWDYIMGKPSAANYHKQDDDETTESQQGESVKSKMVTSPHSGHFMTSNLEDDDDYVDGLGRGLGVEGPDPSASTATIRSTFQDKKGYNFEDACKTPKETYRFHSSGSQHYVKNFDSSLNKLFACMSLAYNGKLTTPKFKAFKGMTINVWDKMRLNNIIWREWHLQFVRKHKPAVCSFTIAMEDTHSKPQSVVLEGKYWKRKLDIVCIEYQKWRVFYKKKIMPQSKQRLGIQELLNRVANQDSFPHGHFSTAQICHPDNLLLDDDFSMDFSDTLFSTFTQNAQPPNSRDDYYGGLANSDFIQPNLIGLQPTLDDFGTMDTMEPFQDLLTEALGWNSSPSPQHFGGSLGNISAYDQTKLGFSHQVPVFSGHSSLYGQHTEGLLAALHQNHTQTGNQISQAMPSHQTNTVLLDTLPGTIRGETFITSSANIIDSLNQPQQQLWHNSSIILPHFSSTGATHLPDFTLTTATRTKIGPQFSKPKPFVRKPRPIAPKSHSTTTVPSSPFLTQLLTKSRLKASNLSGHLGGGGGGQSKPDLQKATTSSTTNTSVKSKTIVPDLVAISGGQSVAANQLSSPPGSVSDGEVGNSPQSAEDVFLSPKVASEEQRDPRPPSVVSTTAEQKRRSHIKNGFETIQTLVPALANSPNNKISKAAMLSKTAEFAAKLKTERQQMQEESDLLQGEINALSSAISSCQSQLPATGVPVTRQHSDQMKQMLDAYIRERTQQNFKFYIFSQLVTPMFESFNGMVSTTNVDELYRTTQTWLDQHCTLPSLRPAVLNSLRTIGTETSILSDPDKFPEQAREAVNKAPAAQASQSSPASTYSTSTFPNKLLPS